MLTRRHPMKPTRMPKKRERPRRGPERSPEYLAWIRTLPCVVCHRQPTLFLPIEAAHTHGLGPRGMGQRSSDYSVIPLCFWHHRGDSDSYHSLGERTFAALHGLDIPSLVDKFNAKFRLPTGPRREATDGPVQDHERSAGQMRVEP
jgi:hypothetical protein